MTMLFMFDVLHVSRIFSHAKFWFQPIVKHVGQLDIIPNRLYIESFCGL